MARSASERAAHRGAVGGVDGDDPEAEAGERRTAATSEQQRGDVVGEMQADRGREVAGPHGDVGEDEADHGGGRAPRARRWRRARPGSSAAGRRGGPGSSNQTSGERKRAARPCIRKPRKAISSAAVWTRSAGERRAGARPPRRRAGAARTGGGEPTRQRRGEERRGAATTATPAAKARGRKPPGPSRVRGARRCRQPRGDGDAEDEAGEAREVGEEEAPAGVGRAAGARSRGATSAASQAAAARSAPARSRQSAGRARAGATKASKGEGGVIDGLSEDRRRAPLEIRATVA